MAFPEKRTERKKSTQGFVVVARRVGVVTEKIRHEISGREVQRNDTAEGGGWARPRVTDLEQKGSPRGETLG